MLEERISQEVKAILYDEGIDLNRSHFATDQQSVQEQAMRLKNLMPKIEYSQLILMSGFIEQNREKLKALAKKMNLMEYTLDEKLLICLSLC